MSKLIKWIDKPLKRFGTAYLLMVVGTFLSTLFLPLGVLVICGLLLLLMLGQTDDILWQEGKPIQCPICAEQTNGLLVEYRRHMRPFLPYLNKRFVVYLNSDYFLICGKCLDTHVGKRELDTILAIANGGMAHAKRITKEEFEELKN